MTWAPITIEHKQYARRIRIQEVMRRTGLGRSTIYSRIKKKMFPEQALKEDGTTTATWFEDEIDAYNESTRNEPRSIARGKRKAPVREASEPTPRGGTTEPHHKIVREGSAQEQPSRRKHVGGSKSEFSPTGVSIGTLRMVRHSATRKVFIEVGDLSLQDLLTALTEALQVSV